MTATVTTDEVMLMNPFTGSVAPESEWREDFAKRTPEEREMDDAKTFEDWSAGLIEVVWDDDAQDWVEPTD